MIHVMSWVALVVACASAIWFWCQFLEHDPRYDRIRTGLLGMLGAAVTLELLLCWVQGFHVWVLIVLLAAYSWGALEAILRFPSSYDPCSLFSMKQFSLLVLKVCCLTLSYRSCEGSIRVCYFTMLVMNILMLPLMYCLSLPLDSSESEDQLASKAVIKTDLLIHFLRLATNCEAREECMRCCKRQVRSVAVDFARRSDVAAWVVLRRDPGLKSVVHSGRHI